MSDFLDRVRHFLVPEAGLMYSGDKITFVPAFKIYMSIMAEAMDSLIASGILVQAVFR